MRTRSRSVALLLFDEVELLDVAASLAVLSSAGRKWNWRPFKVTTVAVRAGRITTRNQLVIEAAGTLDDCPEPELLILPGGYGARRAARDDALVAWARKAGSGAELVLALGSGGLLAAGAGLADDQELAVPVDAGEFLAEIAPKARPAAVGAGVVESGRLLSAAHSALALDVALAAVGRLLGQGQARSVAAALGHDRNAAPEPLLIEVETRD